MKLRALVALGVGVYLAAATVSTPYQPTPPANRWAFTAASCDENDQPFDVEPNTAAALADATAWCERSGAAINNAPWPSGFTPAPIP